MPNGLLNFGEVMQDFYHQTVGQPRALQGQGSAGLVRGGASAFESLLQSPMGREKFTGQMIEMGWLEDVVHRTISYLQIISPSEGMRFIQNSTDLSGNPMFEEKTVTINDLRNSWDLRINLRSKMKNSVAETSIRLMEYDRLSQDPTVNQDALKAETFGESKMRRITATREEQQENLQRQAAMQQASQAGPTQGEQALAGGAAQVSGGVR